MRKGGLLFCVFLIAVASYAIFAATGWSFKTKLFPLSVSIPLLILATAQLLLMILGKEETSEGAAMDVDFSSDVPPEIARRRVFGDYQSTEPSRFLDEIPPELMDRIEPAAPRWQASNYELRNPYGRRYANRPQARETGPGYSYENEDQSASGGVRVVW